MASASAPEYSSLCESDATAYSEYIAAYKAWVALGQQNGWNIVVFGGQYRTGGFRAVGGGCADVGGRLGGAGSGGFGGGTGGLRVLDVGPSGVAAVGDGCVGRGISVAAERGEVGAVGVPSGHSDGGVGGVVDGALDNNSPVSTSGSGESGALVGERPVGAGANWEANRKRRLAKAQRKARARVSKSVPAVVVSEEEELRASLRRKWKAQNDLETLKAEQALEVAKRADLEQLVRCKRAKLVKATEQSFVAIEKAHGTLVATGNVPGVVPETGYATTVVDGSGVPTLVSGSISPSSSVSEAEVRRMQKELEDQNCQLREMRAKFKAIGIDPDKFKPEKDEWTMNSEGGFVDQEALDETYPDGYAFVNENRTLDGRDGDGKIRVRVVRTGWGVV